MENKKNSTGTKTAEWQCQDGPNVPGAYDGTYETPPMRPIPRGAQVAGIMAATQSVQQNKS